MANIRMGDACSLFPYSTDCDHLTLAHSAEFERLNRAIHGGSGFRPLFAQYNSPYYRDHLVDRLRLLHEGSAILHVDREKPAGFRQLQTRMIQLSQTSPCLHLLGLEHWKLDAETQWLPALNQARESLARECRIPVVSWMPGRLIKLAALHAPDVWAWRTGVFDFSVTAKVEGPRHIQENSTFLTETEVERRRKRISEIQAYLESHPETSPGLRASLTRERGKLHAALGEPKEAESCLGSALEIYRKEEDEFNAIVTLGDIADILQARGELDEALRIRREEQLPVYERLGDVRERAMTMGKIADILQTRGELDETLRIRREEQLPVYERLGDVHSRAVTMGKIADILKARGELDEALQIYHEEPLPVAEKLGDVRGHAVTMGKIADILQARGELNEALQIRREKELKVYKRLGDVRSSAVTMGQIADIHQLRGEFDEALRIREYDELPIYESLGDLRSCAVTMGKIADILQTRGKLAKAFEIRKNEVLPRFKKLADPKLEAIEKGKMADILQAWGDLDEALQIRLEEELPVYERLGDVRSRAVTIGKVADIHQRRGELDEALRIRREEQIPVFERLRDVREKLITQVKMGINCLQKKPPRRTEANHLLCQALADARRMGIPEADTIQKILEDNDMRCDSE